MGRLKGARENRPRRTATVAHRASNAKLGARSRKSPLHPCLGVRARHHGGERGRRMFRRQSCWVARQSCPVDHQTKRHTQKYYFHYTSSCCQRSRMAAPSATLVMLELNNTTWAV